MASTTNFGWTTPDNTGYVKDGALAIRTLGSAIDTSLVDLKGGTTDQVLKKASNTDMDFVWGTTNLPAFSVYGSSNQTPTTNVWTKITFNTEVFDTNSNFDTSTSRFTPTVAGYYQINGSLDMDSTSSAAHLLAIYKNGSLDKYLSQIILSGENIASGSAIIYLNGSTDYVELYGRGTAGTITFYAGSSSTHFTGVGIRS